mmetsp:Transcript_3131/g.7264  ORF Transcript_3131/g.7264 Transcript_3131/m.7264 type:complete len:182 (-) Transcript_3131:39-584(-)
MDLRIGDNIEAKLVEISLFGTVAPKAATNFKSLCTNELGYGYKGSDIFRVISTFSLQGGSIGQPLGAQPAQRSRYGRAGLTEPNSNQPYGEPFDPDNYRILHSYREAGVISMMKDLTNKGKLDSRFFITFSPYASWADSKYEAFGRVSKGMDLISAIQIVPVEPPSNYPKSRIEIVDSGCY